MISHADYETPASETVDPAAASGVAPVFDPRTFSATAAIAELVKQTKEFHEWTTRQISASRERAGAPSPQPARPKEAATGNAGQEQESRLPHDPALNAEKAAAADEPELDEPPAKVPAGSRQVIPSGHAAPEEQTENAVRPELPGAGRDFKHRVDSARGRLRNDTQNPDELEALLDQTIALLESVSQHPAIRDYSANKRKLEEIEQRLGYGSYPQ